MVKRKKESNIIFEKEDPIVIKGVKPIVIDPDPSPYMEVSKVICPPRILKRVLFPAALGANNPIISPLFISKFKSLNIFLFLYSLFKLTNLIINSLH